MKPIIKWPGGKSGEIQKIHDLIPPFDRYIEPFFGGGALFFHLMPPRAAVNDISASLMEFYRFVQAQDPLFQKLLLCYNDSFENLFTVCDGQIDALEQLFRQYLTNGLSRTQLLFETRLLTVRLMPEVMAGFRPPLLPNRERLSDVLTRSAFDKLTRTAHNHKTKPFSDADLRENLVTGYAAGYYTYFRDLYNDYLLGRAEPPTPQHRAANFYFMREYCYGSMFRFNNEGEFNIPYGGMSYNRKNFRAKTEGIFCPEIAGLFAGAQLYCADFEEFLEAAAPAERDFLFLDPPYDTRFSDYDGSAFGRGDQRRLAACLRRTNARFIMVIQDSDFIRGLYASAFHILTFENQYTYNVRSRNERGSDHLIITNFDPPCLSPDLARPL